MRRSVNDLGDIAKDHPKLVFGMCERWLSGATKEDVKWLIRHALRHPAKEEDTAALQLKAANYRRYIASFHLPVLCTTIILDASVQKAVGCLQNF